MSETDPLARLVSALAEATNALDDYKDQCPPKLWRGQHFAHKRMDAAIDAALSQVYEWQDAEREPALDGD